MHELCKVDAALKKRLDAMEDDALAIAGATPSTAFSHTNALLTELAETQDWALLREQAERHLVSHDMAVATLAKRMIALSLANSHNTADKEVAIEFYRSLIGTGSSEISDSGNLTTLLAEAGNFDEARIVVLDGIRKFPAKAEYFVEIGQKIVEATGDKDFRKQMDLAIAEREKSD